MSSVLFPTPGAYCKLQGHGFINSINPQTQATGISLYVLSYAFRYSWQTRDILLTHGQ